MVVGHDWMFDYVFFSFFWVVLISTEPFLMDLQCPYIISYSISFPFSNAIPIKTNLKIGWLQWFLCIKPTLSQKESFPTPHFQESVEVGEVEEESFFWWKPMNFRLKQWHFLREQPWKLCRNLIRYRENLRSVDIEQPPYIHPFNCCTFSMNPPVSLMFNTPIRFSSPSIRSFVLKWIRRIIPTEF